MSCMDRNRRGRARLFSPVIYEKIARLASNFEMLNPDWTALQFAVAYPSLAAAARLRSRRHCIMDAAPTSVLPDPPRNFGACDFMEDSCNACPATFRRRAISAEHAP